MFWLNDPSTVSPITADNLSRMEKFTLATAGANGDFYVNFPNGGSIATNDIVSISFPAATNGASNARLSVNNGTTYKNIVLTTTRIASEVQNRKLNFVYDGTNFVPLETEFFPIAYVPTITAGTGTITSHTTTASYIRKGNVITYNFSILITNKGTGAGALIITMPVVPTIAVCAGVGDTAGGVSGALFVAVGGATGSMLKYDASTLIATNARISCAVSYIV